MTSIKSPLKKFARVKEVELLKKLEKETKFSGREVSILAKIYKKFLNGPIMDKDTFFLILHNCLGMTNEYFMERVFYTADTDEDKAASLEEFIRALSVMLRGTIQDKVKFCFTAYDINGELSLTKDDITQLLKHLWPQQYPVDEAAETVQDLVEFIFRKMDLDSDGIVSFHEYKAAVLNNNLLLETFGPVLPKDKFCKAFLAMFADEDPLQEYY